MSMIVVVVLVAIAGAANAVMDKLVFHYNKSIFSKLPSWNPNESWKNKWKLDSEGNPIPGKERFPLSSTALVFLTDAWHFFQFVMLSAFTIAILIYDPSILHKTPLLPNSPFWNSILFTAIEFGVLKIVFGVTFELFFSKVFTLKDTQAQAQSFYSTILNSTKDDDKFVQQKIDKFTKEDNFLYRNIEGETYIVNRGDEESTNKFIEESKNMTPIQTLEIPTIVGINETVKMKQPTNTVPVTPSNSVIKTTDNMDIAKRTPGSVLRDIECYSANVSELAKELRIELVDPVTDQFKPVTLEFAVATINTTVAKFKETMAECEGKDDFSFTLPDGTVGTVVNIVLELLGIDL